jgi:uncharacterized membrane protein YcaP (DUF421 family)
MFDQLLGLDVSAQHLTFQQMALRSVIVFVVGVAMVRVADRRFMGRNAAFDVLLGIVLGSVLSRAVNGQAPFFPTLGASAVLIVLHRLLGWISSRSSWVSMLVKDQPVVVVRNGRIQEGELARHNLTEDDLQENLRLNGNVDDVVTVKEARLERNGVVSVVKDAGRQ